MMNGKEYQLDGGLCMKTVNVKLPEIPEKRFLITEYGAVPNGKASNTKAIAAAID